MVHTKLLVYADDNNCSGVKAISVNQKRERGFGKVKVKFSLEQATKAQRGR